MSEIVRVPFHGEDILTVDVDGKPHVILKPAIEALGLEYWSQIEKLRKRSWAALGKSQVQVPGDRQRRELLTCDVRTFLMMLASVDENRVSEDVRAKLIAYQAESAQAIEDYWTKGAAINPRLDLTKQAEVIDILRRGSGDQGWWETKARQLAGRALGELPDYDPATRPLTVSTFLEQQGLSAREQRKLAPTFGKHLKTLYRVRYGQEPPTITDLVNRHMVSVAQYREEHRPLFTQVWSAMNLRRGA